MQEFNFAKRHGLWYTDNHSVDEFIISPRSLHSFPANLISFLKCNFNWDINFIEWVATASLVCTKRYMCVYKGTCTTSREGVCTFVWLSRHAAWVRCSIFSFCYVHNQTQQKYSHTNYLHAQSLSLNHAQDFVTQMHACRGLNESLCSKNNLCRISIRGYRFMEGCWTTGKPARAET